MTVFHDSDSSAHVDGSIDALIPPPAPRARRFVVGVAIVSVVGFVSALVGFGYVYPRFNNSHPVPEGVIVRAPDGRSVEAMPSFYNASRSTLRLTSVEPTLPGASVVATGYAPEAGTLTRNELPVLVKPGELVRIVVDFVPDCSAAPTGPDWGSVTIHVETVSSWLPTVGRDYRLEQPLMSNQFDVYWARALQDDPERNNVDQNDERAVACAVLAER